MEAVGLGTMGLAGTRGLRVIRQALQLGYRHFDTAVMYRNEEILGQAIEEEKEIERKDIFITTKILWKDLTGDPERIIESLNRSLKRLKMKYVDLLLLHVPTNPDLDVIHWQTLIELQKKGLTKHIGVSNYSGKQLEELTKRTGVAPYTNQIELNLFLRRKENLEVMHNLGIIPTAHTPLSRGFILENETLNRIAEETKSSPAQVMIKWGLQKGITMIPRASSEKHLKENLAAKDLPLLTKKMMEDLDAIKERQVWFVSELGDERE